MFTKTIALLAIAAVANCQYLHAPHVGAQAEHTVRGYGGLSTVSHQSKAVVSPYSSVQKTDTRLTNDLAYAHHGYAPAAYAHHGYAHAAAAPVYSHHAGYAAPAAYHHGYAAPAYAHHGYAAAPAAFAHGYAAPAVAAPAFAHGYAAPVAKAVAPAYGGLGHAYSAVPAVASHTFSRTYGHGTLAYAY